LLFRKRPVTARCPTIASETPSCRSQFFEHRPCTRCEILRSLATSFSSAASIDSFITSRIWNRSENSYSVFCLCGPSNFRINKTKPRPAAYERRQNAPASRKSDYSIPKGRRLPSSSSSNAIARKRRDTIVKSPRWEPCQGASHSKAWRRGVEHTGLKISRFQRRQSLRNTSGLSPPASGMANHAWTRRKRGRR